MFCFFFLFINLGFYIVSHMRKMILTSALMIITLLVKAQISRGTHLLGGTVYLSTNKMSSVYLNIYPGLSYAMTKSFHLELSINNLLSLGYTSSNIVNSNSGGQISSNKNSGFSFVTNANSSFPFSIGFSFLF